MAKEKLNPYEKAVNQFNALGKQPFSAEAYVTSLNEVQSFGFSTGVEHTTLYWTLERMTGVPLQRATETNDPSTERFSLMQTGFRAALDRLNNVQNPQTPPRSQSDVAAG